VSSDAIFDTEKKCVYTITAGFSNEML